MTTHLRFACLHFLSFLGSKNELRSFSHLFKTMLQIPKIEMLFASLLLLVLGLTQNKIAAQTLINPATDGGFELGTTFAANGWTAVNPTVTPNAVWYVGTLAAGYSGARGAYIGNTANTANNYNTGTSRVAHFYKNVTIPAGATQMNISFSLKGNGEVGWDRLLVYTAPTTVTPVANAPASSGTALAGATLRYTQAALYAAYTTITIPAFAVTGGTTMRIIFTWQNDNLFGTQPPAAVDNISVAVSAPCTGTPAGGTAAASPSATCSGASFTVTNTGQTTGPGISYQWQSSPNNSTWTNVGAASATYAPLTATQTAATYYRLLTTCTTSGISTGSASTLVSMATCCNYTFRLTDSFGDGWNGATMQLRIGTTVIATFGPTFTTGTLLNIPQSLIQGTSYNLYYVGSGTYPGEVGVQILDPSNTVIYTLAAGGGTVGTTLHTWSACPTCFVPSGVNITAITGNSATINWTAAVPAPSNGYQWEVRTSGAAGSGAAGLVASGSTAAGVTTANVTGLASLTGYSVYVRSYCGGIDYSSWTAATAFVTLCGGVTCNYTFRLTDSFGDGWNGATMQVRVGTSVVATLGPTFTTGTQLNVLQSLCSGATYNLYYVGGGTYPGEVGIQILDFTGTVIYTLGAGAGAVGATLTTWTANCPTCFPPSGVNMTAITGNSATINWTAASPAPSNGYQWEVRTSGAAGSGAAGLVASGNTAAGVTTANVTGLSGATGYSVYVRSYCGGIDYSTWTAATTFVTLCSGATCSYTFRLTDSWGDGWNGATMQLRLGTAVVATFGPTFTTGLQLDIPISLCDGVAYNLYYVGSGAFPGEVGIQILNAVGTNVYTLAAGAGAVGTTLTTFTTACPTIEASVTNLAPPVTAVCQGNTSNNITVQINNTGINALASGAVSVTLTATGANTGTYTFANSITLAPGGNQVVTFSGVNLTNLGTTNLSVTLTLAGDALAANNTTTSSVVTQPVPTGVTATATPNSSCAGAATNIQLTATPNGPITPPNYSLSAIPFAPVTGTPSGTLAGDDVVSAAVPIGFNFSFYGNVYTNVYISTNGFLSFDAAVGSGCCAGQLLPNATAPNNVIATCWTDLNTGGGGTIDYFNLTSPNRLVIRYNGVAHYLGTPQVTSQIILYETGVIEIHNTSINAQGTMTQGIEDATGASAIAVPGGNSTTTFTATNNAYRFTPWSYSYAWTPTTNMSNATIYNPVVSSVASNTTYTVSVTNGFGCSATADATVTISNVSASVSSQTNVNCLGGSDGDVTIVAIGGVAPYTYQLGTGAFQGNGFFSGLSAATYTITAKDANNCTTTVSVTITEPSSLVDTTSIVRQHVSCNGGSNGEITISGSGGTPNYQYQINGGGYGSSGTFSGLTAGNYTLMIRDAALCTFTVPVTVTEPAILSGSIVSQTAIVCNDDGSVYVTASGGVGPYQYSIDGGALGTSSSFSSLTLGLHNVLIQDYNGCQFTLPVTIVNGVTVTVATVTQVNAPCFGGNGSVTINITGGGTAPYDYYKGIISWPTMLGYNIGATLTTSQAAGTETYFIVDDLGCYISFPVTITQPTPLSATEMHVDALCFGGNGSVTISATGGTAPYTGTGTFSQAAGTQTYTVTDANGCSATISATVAQPAPSLFVTETHVDALCFGANGSVTIAVTGGTAPYTGTGTFSQAVGAQTYTVTDANGCTATTSITITQPTTLTASSVETTAISCNGGNAVVTVSASGGTSPYTGTGAFNQAVGSQTYTVTDANGCTATTSITISQPTTLTASSVETTAISCNGGNAVVTVSASGGTAPYTGTGTFNQAVGSQTYTVTDANGCTATTSITISQPTTLTASSVETTAISCNGGNAVVTVSASGGTAPYTGTGAFNQAVGAQTYTVTDANGCTATTSITITQPTLLTASSVETTAISCNGGNAVVTVSASGGTSPYTGTGTFNQAVGSQTYTVTDANGCTATTSITISQPTTLTASSVETTAISCNGGNAVVTVSASGGTAPYTGTGTFNQAVGSQTYTVTDANGCTATTSITISQPTTLTASSVETTSISCNGGNAVVTVSASGGTSPYTGTGTFNQAVGSQTYTVTDANGCTATTSITITQPTLLTASSVETTAISCNGGNAVVTVSASGGTSPYTGTGTFNQAVGSQTYTVTDANGCTATTSITISQPVTLAVNIDAITQVNCYGQATGEITVSASGGTSPYSYNIDGGGYAAMATFSNLTAGTYILGAQDASGCTATVSATITQPANPPSVNPVTPVVVCAGEAITIAFSGSLVSGTNYDWTVSNTAVGLPATGSGDINGTAAMVSSVTNATLTVTPNASGCLGAQETVQITVNPKPSAPTAAVTNFCSSATVWVSTPVTGTIKWYDNNIASGSTLGIGAIVPNVTTNGSYYAYQEIGNCMSDASNALTVNVGMNTHWNTIAAPTPPITSNQVYYADAYCVEPNGWVYYYNSPTNMLLLASDYSIPAGVNLVNHTPTNASEMAVKVNVLPGYASGAAQFINPSTAPYVTNPLGWFVMHRAWQIEVNPANQIPANDSSYVKFYFSNADVFDVMNSSGNVLANFRFYKLASGLDPANPADHAGVTSPEVTVYNPGATPSLSTWALGVEPVTNANYAEYAVASFSGGGGGSAQGGNPSPLPVRLLSFTGENAGAVNQLHWVTEKEQNADYFVVERSLDNVSFQYVGKENATGQANLGENYYHLTDNQPLPNTNFYRLKMVDKNGAFSYSPSIEISNKPIVASFEVYPNPMKDKLSIRMEGLHQGSKVRFTLYNVLGERVVSETWKEQSNVVKEINISHLSQGTYFYECTDITTGTGSSGKLTKVEE
ncbi:MAG: fibronectin type III domain-containing protein [Bacteroidia bacterium]